MTALKATEQASLLGTFVPPGVVMPFAGATAPSGWLICDGAVISTTTYAALFAAIGSTYDAQWNPTNNLEWVAPGAGLFRVPDYRGTFLRGTGTAYQGDACSLGGWQVHKTRKNGLTTGLGGSISSTNLYHTHTIGKVRNDNDFCDDYYGGGIPTPPYTAGGTANTIGSRGPSASMDHGHSHSLSASLGDGDTETRPHNKGVNYIIKY